MFRFGRHSCLCHRHLCIEYVTLTVLQDYLSNSMLKHIYADSTDLFGKFSDLI